MQERKQEHRKRDRVIVKKERAEYVYGQMVEYVWEKLKERRLEVKYMKLKNKRAK